MARMELATVHGAEIAAGPGTADAFLRLGLLHSAGAEGAPDLVSAHKWFNLAALQGSRPARDYRSEIAQEMTPEQIAEAQRQAREWLYSH